MTMPGRGFQAGKYRYGFNGKEKDNSTGEGNLDFGARVYDARIGRWLSVDPLQVSYPSISPFSFSLNSPLMFFDVAGKWVAKVDFNYESKKYNLIFVAEKGDNLNTLSMQLGLPKGTLLKADPSLRKIQIKTGKEIKLEKVKEVNNINYAINFMEQKTESEGPTESDINNCANFANQASGNKNGLIRSGDDGGAADILAGQMAQNGEYADPQFNPVKSDESAKIGDVIHFSAKGDWVQDIHYAVVILKDKTGKSIKGVMQKTGTLEVEKKILSPLKLSIPGTTIPYKRAKIDGSSIFRPKQTVLKDQTQLSDSRPPKQK